MVCCHAVCNHHQHDTGHRTLDQMDPTQLFSIHAYTCCFAPERNNNNNNKHVFPYLSFLCLTATQNKLSLPSFTLLPKPSRIRKQEKLTKKKNLFFASALLLKASKLFAFFYPTLEKKSFFPFLFQSERLQDLFHPVVSFPSHST